DVASVQGRQPGIAHHVAADEGAEALRVARSELGRDGARGATGAVAVKALKDAPSVVGAAPRSLFLEVDLLEQVLAHVADREVAGQPVEAEAVRIAQAVRPDLRAYARPPYERVVLRDSVATAGLRVDADELGEQGVEPLARSERVALAASVPEARPQHPVGPELELAPVVVRLAPVRHAQDVPSRARIGDVGIPRAPKLLDADVAGAIREVDVHPS